MFLVHGMKSKCYNEITCIDNPIKLFECYNLINTNKLYIDYHTVY